MPSSTGVVEHEYVFGFGSIINTATHAPWLSSSSSDNNNNNNNNEEEKKNTEKMNQLGLPGQRATILAKFGYRRGWFFRSNTGFTALGVRRSSNNDDEQPAMDINGVLFRISPQLLEGFDRREVGYDRVEIPADCIKLIPPTKKEDTTNANVADAANNNNHPAASVNSVRIELQPNEKIWVYIPQKESCQLANEEHPILQSYVDTVMQGCLDWGGEDMATEFVQTTTDWSTFFLNDTPSSRRPWLYRKAYTTIDKILSGQNSQFTHFADRRHPEEFASAFLIKMMRGSWSIPRRNTVFTGRDHEIREIHERLIQQRLLSSSSSSSSSSPSSIVAKLQIAGMGGVGKTQICTEYCYRYFPSYYGLVIWLNAQSADSVAADYRQLMADTSGMDVVKDKDTEDVVAEVKSRLFRSKVPWLLVFDNLEDKNKSMLNKFVPNGGPGHVLVTTRIIEMDHVDFLDDQTMMLGCFTPQESIELICRGTSKTGGGGGGGVIVSGGGGGGNNNNASLETKQVKAARILAEHLGHLPLALGMAAAYMRRCDVECSEYLSRYYSVDHGAAAATSATATASNTVSLRPTRRGSHIGYSTVQASLSLSLEAIKRESPIAWEALQILAWLGSDHITKKFIRSLFTAKNIMETEEESLEKESEMSKEIIESSTVQWSQYYAKMATAGAALAFMFVIGQQSTHRTSRSSNTNTIGGLLGIGALALVILANPTTSENKMIDDKDQEVKRPSRSVSTPPFRRVSSSTPSRRVSTRPSRRVTSYGADVFEQTDRTWTILKSFSLLVVKEGQGTMHRLLGESLRMSQSVEDRIKYFNIALRAVTMEWDFKPEQVDTWEDAMPLLEHVKAVVLHSINEEIWAVDTALLSKQAGVFSDIVLNRFEEAQSSLEQSLQILDAVEQSDELLRVRAGTLHELGRLFRFNGSFEKSNEILQEALELRTTLSETNNAELQGVASTLHELGVLEGRKHNLGAAIAFLERALDLRRSLDVDEEDADQVEADCASTLHQLAALQVNLKPPRLDEAELLLKEALGLNMQIGQRAATLKQLARVAIRRGEYDAAEGNLNQAFELYSELYGEHALHTNTAAVRLQQGTLALQRDQYDQAWIHLSECLRARRHVYSYTQGNHIEVAIVYHELGRVAFAQNRFQKANEMLETEREILEQLTPEDGHQHQRIFQAQLTNLTWLKKCSKETGDDVKHREYATMISELKRQEKEQSRTQSISNTFNSLQREALKCRLVARQFALAKHESDNKLRAELGDALTLLSNQIRKSKECPMKDDAERFRQVLIQALSMMEPNEIRNKMILEACDSLRDTLRRHGLQVQDNNKNRK